MRGRQFLRGHTGGRQGAGDGTQRRLVTEGELPGDVEQVPAGGRLELAPAGEGEDCHVDVGRIGVAQAEDPRVALRPGASVAGPGRRFQDGHPPPAPAERPRARQS